MVLPELAVPALLGWFAAHDDRWQKHWSKTENWSVMRWIALSVGAAMLVIGSVVLTLLWQASRDFPEIHARESLKYLTELADEAITEMIPQGRYMDAVDNAEAMERFYPVGSVLPKGHAFAGEYRHRRQELIDSVIRALRATTGLSCGRDWTLWRQKLRLFDSPERAGK